MTSLLIPIGLALLMLNIGLSLKAEDFRRALLNIKAVAVALFCQAVLMPVVCFFIAKSFGLMPELAFGLMLLASSPGGILANIYSHLAGGDVALNITLTAVNSLLSLVTMPLILGFSAEHFLGGAKSIPLTSDKIVQVVIIVLVPVFIGMFISYLRPALSQVIERPVKILTVLFLIAVAAMVVIAQQHQLVSNFSEALAAVIVFNVICALAGYLIALWAKLARRQAIAISMELGIHNGTLAIGLALSPMIFNSATIAIPPMLYSVTSLLIAGIFTVAFRRGGNVLSRREK